MIDVHWWKAGRQEGSASPFGRPETVTEQLAVAERAMRSLTTWNSLNDLSVYVTVGHDPVGAIETVGEGLHPLNRRADGELVHITYVANPWRHAHVVFRTMERIKATGVARYLAAVGHEEGRCINDPEDLFEPEGAPPYFVWVLTGELPKKVDERAPVAAKAPSLVSLASED